MKYNGWCDGSFRDGMGYIGYVIRDEHEQLVHYGRHQMVECTNGNEAELFAALTLVQEANRLGLSSITIYTDSNVVADNLEVEDVKHPVHNRYIQQIRSYLTEENEEPWARFRWIPRILNFEADYLCTENFTPLPNSNISVEEKKQILYHLSFTCPYIITNRIREQYKELSPSSYRKSKSIKELDMKIIKAIRLGKVIRDCNDEKTIHYWNLRFKLKGNVVKSITYSRRPFIVDRYVKAQWYEDFAREVHKEQKEHTLANV
ncbi:hypothetical protein CN918_31350 [Priestia megaterium]|nr:hypothetical protein CN918_31350 [Priestia megaterium]